MFGSIGLIRDKRDMRKAHALHQNQITTPLACSAPQKALPIHSASNRVVH
jgi:hypothetical protein